MKWEQVVLNPEDLQILEQHIRQLTPEIPFFPMPIPCEVNRDKFWKWSG
jgi:hypothetical protein